MFLINGPIVKVDHCDNYETIFIFLKPHQLDHVFSDFQTYFHRFHLAGYDKRDSILGIPVDNFDHKCGKKSFTTRLSVWQYLIKNLLK